MSTYAFVLGDNYLAYMIGAVVLGVLSALLFSGPNKMDSAMSLGSLQTHVWKAGLIAAYMFVIWRESDDAFHAVVKASVPIGVYKITQIFVSLLIVWRAQKGSSEHNGEVIRNG